MNKDGSAYVGAGANVADIILSTEDFDPIYGITMCMSIMKKLGMDEIDIFRAVTTTPARVLNKEYSSLKVGANADIAVLEYKNNGFDITDKWGNTINSEHGYKCALTMVNGQIMYRN